jgi:hypothetical protein
MKVLALFANPRGTNALRLGEEDRVLQECIRRSKNRDSIKLDVRHAATIDDARRALLDVQYDVVHFSGHGTGNGLAFEDSTGSLFVPPEHAVAELLAAFSPPLHCVLFNACYSSRQAAFTAFTLPFTVAMDGPIADDAAIVFSGAFYDSLAAGRDVPFSFNQGLVALKLAGHPDSVVPRLVQRGVADSTSQADVQPLDASLPREITPLILGFAMTKSAQQRTAFAFGVVFVTVFLLIALLCPIHRFPNHPRGCRCRGRGIDSWFHQRRNQGVNQSSQCNRRFRLCFLLQSGIEHR